MSTDNSSVLPKDYPYHAAVSRSVIRTGDAGIGISFDISDGKTVRLFLGIQDAESFCAALLEALK